MQEQETPEKLINPIDGLPVDEVLKEKDAKEKGYLEPEFYFKYLEDENEFVKLFIVNGKRILVDISRPMLQYKKDVSINQERVLADKPIEACNIQDHDGTCEMCSG